MDGLTIDPLDPLAERELRARAARHGRSPGEEARRILIDALAPEPPAPAATWEPPSEEEVRRRVERILSHGRKLEEPFDLKAESDALWDFAE